MEVPQTAKNRATIESSNPAPRNIPRKKNYSLHGEILLSH